MNAINRKKIYEDFPDLYRGKNKSMKESLMCFGFECGDGWFELIYNLSKSITDYCNKNNIPVPEVSQVKEKFGSLRFHIRGANDDIYKMIQDAENISSKTCEICGRLGIRQAINFWYSTLCDEHAELKTRRGIIKKST